MYIMIKYIHILRKTILP